jgi:flagellar biosynthesis/type III secretory pathway chaperone
MSLPDLAAVLWRQRDLLERLTYRLECEQLMLAAGRIRFLATATAEVETLVSELRTLELHRAATSEQAAVAAGLDPSAGLEELAAAVQPPWTGVLLERREALIVLTRELGALAETNRTLMAAGMRTVESALASLGGREQSTSVGYDARGRSDLVTGAGPMVVDRAL